MISLMRRNLFNPVLFGKALASASQIITIIIVGQTLDANLANAIFSLLAISTIISAIASFGANGALVPFLYKNAELEAPIVAILLLMKIIVILTCTAIFTLMQKSSDIIPLLLFWTSLTCSLQFIDYIAESRGPQEVFEISRLKVIVFSIGLPLKITLIYTSIHVFLISLYIEWLAVWAIYIPRKLKFINLYKEPFIKALGMLRIFLIESSWVWASTILNLGWTRIYFFIVNAYMGPTAANAYFTILRVIDGLMILPNSIAMMHFPKILKEHVALNQAALQNAKKFFYRDVILTSIGTAIIITIACVTLAAMHNVAIYEILTISSLVFIAAVFTFCRVLISREIILINALPLSLLSYLSAIGACFGALLIIGMDTIFDALLGYLAFATAAILSPIYLLYIKHKNHIHKNINVTGALSK